mmetsp:Transcript_67093/g.185817  ORF Transcript_67093/g.185817 Transcript_67093/m.185817 type:complete len:204 (-) Transcript_67093:388-999(-)
MRGDTHLSNSALVTTTFSVLPSLSHSIRAVATLLLLSCTFSRSACMRRTALLRIPKASPWPRRLRSFGSRAQSANARSKSAPASTGLPLVPITSKRPPLTTAYTTDTSVVPPPALSTTMVFFRGGRAVPPSDNTVPSSALSTRLYAICRTAAVGALTSCWQSKPAIPAASNMALRWRLFHAAGTETADMPSECPAVDSASAFM